MKVVLGVLVFLCGGLAMASSDFMPETTEKDLVDAYIDFEISPIPEPMPLPDRPKHEVPLSLISDSPVAEYATPFQEGHPECQYVSPTLMRCPTNDLNKRQNGESEGEFLDREIAFGFRHSEDYPGCSEQDGNIMLCPKAKHEN